MVFCRDETTMKDDPLTYAQQLSIIASEIINFILKSHGNARDKNKHIASLAAMMKEIEDEYNAPLLMSWSKLYQSKRRQSLTSFQPEKQTLNEQLLILQTMTDFMKADCPQTISAKLTLIEYLLKQVQCAMYLKIDLGLLSDREHHQKIINCYLSLSNLFILKAKKVLAQSNSTARRSAEIIEFKPTGK